MSIVGIGVSETVASEKLSSGSNGEVPSLACWKDRQKCRWKASRSRTCLLLMERSVCFKCLNARFPDSEAHDKIGGKRVEKGEWTASYTGRGRELFENKETNTPLVLSEIRSAK